MKGKPKKSNREKDLTSRYNDGELDEDRMESIQRFTNRSKYLQRDKTLKTSLMRAEAQNDPTDINSLPIGQVTMVYSRYCEVEFEGRSWLCQVRKTLTKVSGADIVVGDFVRFRDEGTKNESGRTEAIVEQMLPRKTVLTRSDSFKQITPHPIVANAQQMLIVVSLREPDVKWGLVDRMIIAAQGGGLVPIVCLNKVDLHSPEGDDPVWDFAQGVLSHYASLEIPTLRTCAIQGHGIEQLREILREKVTVLAGHSGVGKSSLIRAVQPSLDLRVAEISGYTGKGRHTTTSARRYNLDVGGAVIDTPGVKLFGLWGITRENLIDHFPDIANHTAPPWRVESYQRIESSLK
jgi:ribosome biogenesis GTPase